MLIGPEEQVFTVHRDAICAKSKFFKAACSEWEGDQAITVTLPKVDGKVFQNYVDWIYGNTLMAASTVDEDVEMAIKLNLLGDVLDDGKLDFATAPSKL